MATATSQLLVDWDGDLGFGNANSDVSTDIDLAEELTWEYGRNYGSQIYGKSVTGKLTVTLINDAGLYSRHNSGSPLFGLVLPNRRVRLRVATNGGGFTTQWEGTLDDIAPLPGRGGRHRVRLTALGIFNFLQGRKAWVAQQTGVVSGAAVTSILDHIGFPAGDRSVDAGQFTMGRWGAQGNPALQELQKIEDFETGFLRETKDGKLAFEDGHHRLIGPHLTSQVTYSDDVSGSGILYEALSPDDGLKDVANIIPAQVKLYTVGAEQVLWTLGGLPDNAPLLNAGESITLIAEYPGANSDPSRSGVETWTTPVATTDYAGNSQADGNGADRTGDVAVAVVKAETRMEMTFTNNNGAGAPLFLSFLQARGTPVTEGDSIQVLSQSQPSIDDYGPLDLKSNVDRFRNVAEAKDYADYLLTLTQDPLMRFTVTYVANLSQAALDDALARDLSDRVTVQANTVAGQGVNEDFYIEHIRHRVQHGVHRVQLQTSPASVFGDFLVLDLGQLDVNTLAR